MHEHVAGRHDRLGRSEVLDVAQRVRRGEPGATFGLDLDAGLGPDAVLDVVSEVWGWDRRDAVFSTDPVRTLTAAGAAFGRVQDVARRGGTIAFATSRPASLLGLYACLGRRAAAAGASVAVAGETDAFAARTGGALRVWWIDGVAVTTDGRSLLPGDGVVAAEEWLFEIARPDLVVADRGFAARALAHLIEVVAFADVDALALAVAAGDGLPVTVVPMACHRPPAAYRVLEELAAAEIAPAARGAEPGDAAIGPEARIASFR